MFSRIHEGKALLWGIVLAFGIFAFAQGATPFRVLGFYTPYMSMDDQAHAAYAKEANTWLKKVSTANGFIYDSTTDFGGLNATNLAKYKVIIFMDNYPGDGNQRSALQTYVTNGGGFIGCHVSAFNQNPSAWDWYFNQFLAMGSYKNNTWAPTTAVLTVEDTTFFITKGFPKKFTAPVNEWYAWNNDLRKNPNIKVLCSINSASYPLGTGTGAGGASEIWHDDGSYRPIIWTNTKYKMMYTNIGHDDVDYNGQRIPKTHAFDTVLYAKLFLNAIKYCAGVTTSIENGKEAAAHSAEVNQPAIAADAKSVVISLARAKNITVTVTDLKGRTVYRTHCAGGACRIALGVMGHGTFFVQATSGNGVFTRPIVLK